MITSFPRQILQMLGLSLGLFALCAWPAHLWGGGEGLAALGAAAGICFLGAVVARGAGELLRRLDPGEDAGPRAVQASIGVRMLVTLVASMPILLIQPFPQIQFVVWLATNYLLHLGLEVFVSLRHLGQNHAPSEQVGSPAAPIDQAGSQQDSQSAVPYDKAEE